jgi:tRNA pseudouridine13 synthase
MKLKRLPEDFQVEELAEVALDGGPFAVYRLTKRSLGTLEALAAVQRRWQLERPRISYGGLKDRYALSHQFITIADGPRANLRQTNFELVYLGQRARPFRSQDMQGNRFHIALRHLSTKALAQAECALAAAVHDGLPNYFDDQRFGSLGASGTFIAHAWCEGDYERALWLSLAEPNAHDRPREREQKRLLRQHWGDWARCLRALAQSERRQVIGFLARRPGDFRGAMARLRVDLRHLYLAAFQSFLWNRMLAAWLRHTCRPEQLVQIPLRIDAMPFPSGLDPSQRAVLHSATLPLPSARAQHLDHPQRALMEQVVHDVGLELRQLRVKNARDSFFAKGTRAATFVLRNLKHTVDADEVYAGQSKLTLHFDLPRGAYATIVIKRLTVAMAR